MSQGVTQEKFLNLFLSSIALGIFQTFFKSCPYTKVLKI